LSLKGIRSHITDRPWRPADVARAHARHRATIRRLTALREESKTLIYKGTGYDADPDATRRINDAREHDVFGDVATPVCVACGERAEVRGLTDGQPYCVPCSFFDERAPHQVYDTDLYADVAPVLWTDHHDAGDCREDQQ